MCHLYMYLKYFFIVIMTFCNNESFVSVGLGGGGKDDTRAVSDKKCGQTGSETASGGEGRHTNGYKYCSVFRSYARYSCIQITVFLYVTRNMVFKENISLFKIEI